MSKLQKLIETLHPLERSVLPVLHDRSSVKEVSEKTNLSSVEVMRALQWLENKKVVKTKKEVQETIRLDTNGQSYVKTGLPERRFLQSLTEPLSIAKIQEFTKLNQQEISISLGLLKKQKAITFNKNKEIAITEHGKAILQTQSNEESFLAKLPVVLAELTEEEKAIYHELKKRHKIVKVETIKERSIFITELGKKLLKSDLNVQGTIDTVTPEIIKSHAWKNKKFRRYDIKINVPKVYPGKRHFVNEAIEYIRKIWVELGFKEMSGSVVQTSFWNFDALFTAQDHPVRELHDTFFIKDPKFGRLPSKELVIKVKKAHESGYATGSKGWQYPWQEKEARKNVLRTHVTALSARTLAQLAQAELPAKFFSIGNCFRNEALDWSHLFEFDQVEGIVIDEHANFKHLLAYLQTFYKKMGYEKIRIRPSYFPYTEPSAEIDVYDKTKKSWLELGGCGMFRPEVVKPLLGKDIPVLAWGLGLARVVRLYYNIKDIRVFYRNDLQYLREAKSWLKV